MNSINKVISTINSQLTKWQELNPAPHAPTWLRRNFIAHLASTIVWMLFQRDLHFSSARHNSTLVLYEGYKGRFALSPPTPTEESEKMAIETRYHTIPIHYPIPYRYTRESILLIPKNKNHKNNINLLNETYSKHLMKITMLSLLSRTNSSIFTPPPNNNNNDNNASHLYCAQKCKTNS